jgi:hypothetical protein
VAWLEALGYGTESESAVGLRSPAGLVAFRLLPMNVVARGVRESLVEVLPLEARSVEWEEESGEKRVEQFPVLAGLRQYAIGDEREHVLLAKRPGSGVFTPALFVDIDDREDYGEDRYVGLGLLDERVVVIFTQPDGNTIRVISLRKATSYERQQYSGYDQN